MTKPKLRNATVDDYEAFYGERPKHSIRALVAELDGKVVGIGGILYSTPILAFSEMREELRGYPLFIMKSAKKLAKMMDKYGQYAIAVACPNEKNSQKLLEHLGFTKISSTDEQEVYQWLIHSRQR